ncbi:GPALPP motifs-containing protein 1-like [Clavelina lepadiformis]|uniref:GPALPP motifs-containing protein 1-like n=1 Tax=Clavelina lepadiformis TaxID=159417 RepID=UPI0040429EE1
MDDCIGPALPPGFKPANVREDVGPALSKAVADKSIAEDIEAELSIGPQLPGNLIRPAPSPTVQAASDFIGPSIPSDNKNKFDDAEDLFGPALPPGFKKANVGEKRVLGPQLPPGFQGQASSDEEDEEIIGPLPPTANAAEDVKDRIARDFEKRAQKMKDKLEGRDEPKKIEREIWMTELPPVLQGFGMGPRQFRANPTEVGDRSGWTDTPADKLKKSLERKNTSDNNSPSLKDVNVVKRDKDISGQLNEYNGAKQQESLLSMHEKKRKRKLKEEKESGKADIRRPFDRDIDLQANKFDEAAKKRMLKQSSGLSSRFSHGETSGTFL